MSGHSNSSDVTRGGRRTRTESVKQHEGRRLSQTDGSAYDRGPSECLRRSFRPSLCEQGDELLSRDRLWHPFRIQHQSATIVSGVRSSHRGSSLDEPKDAAQAARPAVADDAPADRSGVGSRSSVWIRARLEMSLHCRLVSVSACLTQLVVALPLQLLRRAAQVAHRIGIGIGADGSKERDWRRGESRAEAARRMRITVHARPIRSVSELLRASMTLREEASAPPRQPSEATAAALAGSRNRPTRSLCELHAKSAQATGGCAIKRLA